MIIVEGAPISGADSFTVSGLLILRDDSGSGIRHAEVKDQFHVTVAAADFECPPVATIRVTAVERGRLPLFVTATDCSGNKTSNGPPVWTNTPDPGSPGIPLPDSALMCEDNGPCRSAEGDAQRARNTIGEICSRMNGIRSRRDSAAAVAAALAAAVVALVAAGVAAFSAPPFGPIIGAVLLGLAAGVAYFAGVQALLAWREQQNLDKAQAELETARRRFTDAVARVMSTCSPSCISIDLDQPAC